MTTIMVYQNKRNEHKYIEVHNDGWYHNSWRQYLYWSKTNSLCWTGASIHKKATLHRVGASTLEEVLTDYRLIAKEVKA